LDSIRGDPCEVVAPPSAQSRFTQEPFGLAGGNRLAM
jgi:hypothetical protein